MRNRGAVNRHLDEVLLRILNALANGFRNFRRLAHANADATLFVAHDHQRAEAEIATALNDLGNAVYRYHFLFEFANLLLSALHLRLIPP